MIYPALHDLLEGGYVECLVETQGARQRKVCRLTEKGEEAYRAAAAPGSGLSCRPAGGRCRPGPQRAGRMRAGGVCSGQSERRTG